MKDDEYGQDYDDCSFGIGALYADEIQLQI